MKRRLLPFSGGGDNGYDIRTVCRNRCRQKDRCWMSDYGPRPESADGSNSHVRNSGDPTGSASRLAEASGLHSCRDGEYWVVLEPIFNVLEATMTVVLANPAHLKNVPGRKTDVKDCQWLAELLRHGLIRGSFIPPRPIRELRDLTRRRRRLIATGTSERNRTQKVLEDANVKLGCVLSDLFGVSGQDMLEALLEGNPTAEQVA